MIARSHVNFLIVAGVVAHTLWTSVAPSMVYPLYAQNWDLTPTVTAGVFAIYPVVVVATLVLFGGMSDAIGSRRMMAYGVAASAAGVLVFAAASDVAMLFVGRLFMGIGVGLSAGPSAAALVEHAGKGGVQKASSATLVAQAFGFAAGLLVAGALAQYAPFPTRLSFLLLFVLLVALFFGTLSLPRQESTRKGEWRPRLPRIPSALRGLFWMAAFTLMTAYAHGVLIGSLGAQIAHELVRSSNLFVNGGTLALFPLTLGLAGLAMRGLRAPVAILWGAVSSVAGMAFMMAAVLRHDLAFLVAATVSSGAGYAFMVYGSLSLLSDNVPEQIRGATTSAALLLAYLFTGVLAIGLGKLATVEGMTGATLTGALIMVILCMAVITLTIRASHRAQRSARTVACSSPGSSDPNRDRGQRQGRIS